MNNPTIHTPILRAAKERLDYARQVRQDSGEALGKVTAGMIISELIMTHLPAPGEKKAVKKNRAGEALRVVAS